MKQAFLRFLLTGAAASLVILGCSQVQEEIPLPEHPRPDFQREGFVNLNGQWDFTFDATIGVSASQGEKVAFDKKITVPFGWGSALSGVEDEGDIGWYSRTIDVPREWKGKRVFLVVGASDWETSAWIDGQPLETHQGGYTPFEWEITQYVSAQPKGHTLVVRADDSSADFKLYGKQGYGNVRGIWQTVYLEARGENFIKHVHLTPDIDNSLVNVEVAFSDVPKSGDKIRLRFPNAERQDFVAEASGRLVKFPVELKNQHLWDLDDPYLYDVEAILEDDNGAIDKVSTYFGQRKIGVVNLPGTEYPYVALNNKPIYLQLCLDQSYNPDGFYTFPTDEFMKNEILISKNLGLNGNRVHIKVEVPRKLYWADKLGLLIMEDVPNWGGEPSPASKADWERAMRGMVDRDFNHPCVFSRVNFNETWGLFSTVPVDPNAPAPANPIEARRRRRQYLPETQEWVREVYKLNKSLDPSRLVEDNSPCNWDHVETDINTWHSYLPGHMWEARLDEFAKSTYVGSSWNYIGENVQDGDPMFNSECGNVWGYQGSSGDVDITWDYHQMINAFRAHPKFAGWLYTEHHDVINEWNGYVRYDRTPKIFGLEEFVPGMSMKDFHSPYYISPRVDLMQEVAAGSTQRIPLFLSIMTDRNPGGMSLEVSLAGWDDLGVEIGEKDILKREVPFGEYYNKLIDPIDVTIPSANGLYVVRLVLKGGDGQVIGRNFVLYRVKNLPSRYLTFEPTSYVDQGWDVKKWTAMEGRKLNGAGDGYFEYSIRIPEDARNGATLVFEASAKELFGKDMEGAHLTPIEGDYMLGGGTNDHCRVSNSYGQTDTRTFPSKVRVVVNGTSVGEWELPDDPGDHRGALSWFAQGKGRTLDEAGSYGYRIEVPIPAERLLPGKDNTIVLKVPEGKGGLALYGKDSGRYPMDPTIIFK